MSPLFDLLAILAFSQIVFIAVFFLVHHRGTLPRLISLYCFCLSAYTLASIPYLSSNLISFFILLRLATLAPFILWIVAFTLFVDNGKIHPGAWLAMVFFELTRGIGIGIFYLYPETINNISYIFVQIIPQLIMLVFAAHTLYLACQGYSADLLEQRRRARVTFLLIMGVLLVAIVGTDFINSFSRFVLESGQSLLPAIPRYSVSLYIFVMTFLFCQLIFQLNEDAITLISNSEGATVKPKKNVRLKSSVDPSVLRKIQEAMKKEKLYAKTGLTITQLAESLSIQEYKLRRLINQQLQFKNFNQFLNNYRIEDACTRLRETSRPISTIALDVGYASLSVFNKAFKERYGVTPTEFRNREHTQR
ncbi:MAG: helix-turn-helix transcriptional regulator [Gammaproteobacteria bacterium]|nr:helix-turn-helix transcriptional regulator [Gammaproteobacteria bacterium]